MTRAGEPSMAPLLSFVGPERCQHPRSTSLSLFFRVMASSTFFSLPLPLRLFSLLKFLPLSFKRHDSDTGKTPLQLTRLAVPC